MRHDGSIPGWATGQTGACGGMESMRMRKLTWETLARMNDQHHQFAVLAFPPHAIVAPEGSELANWLRSRGWVARSGWRSRQAGRPAIWLVRYESPESVVTQG